MGCLMIVLNSEKHHISESNFLLNLLVTEEDADSCAVCGVLVNGAVIKPVP